MYLYFEIDQFCNKTGKFRTKVIQYSDMFQVNSAVSINKTRSQWVDLGIHTEACMSQPETCGAAGGAISMWVNIIDCSNNGGIITTELQAGKMGTSVYCGQRNIT